MGLLRQGDKELQNRVERASARASKRTRIETFPKLAEVVNGQYRIKDEPPLIYHVSPLDTEAARAFVLEYLASLPDERRMIIMRYRALDIAQKVVGVGSVGTHCFIVLALGGAEGDDPLFMQIKESEASVLEPYLGAGPYQHHGERAVLGQRMMQAASDILLGWSTLNGRDYYVRQLREPSATTQLCLPPSKRDACKPKPACNSHRYAETLRPQRLRLPYGCLK